MKNKFITPVIKSIVMHYPAVMPYLNANAIKAAGYQAVRDTYWAEVYDAVHDYLTGTRPVTAFRNKHLVAMAEAFTEAANLGYEDGGGELPLDDDTAAWLSSSVTEERGHIIDLFDRLKAEWDGIDPIHEAFVRADGYASKLDGIYNEARLRGMKNQMVTWVLGETEVHCDTCLRLAGTKHRISWLLQNDYIPRKSGAAMDCGGWNCDCSIIDKNGNEVTL
jgi:hypothetical protein